MENDGRHGHPTPLRHVEDKEKFSWLVEQKKFRNNFETVRRTSAELAAKRDEFNALFEEIKWTISETRSLRITLNKTALKLGLESLVSRKNRR